MIIIICIIEKCLSAITAYIQIIYYRRCFFIISPYTVITCITIIRSIMVCYTITMPYFMS